MTVTSKQVLHHLRVMDEKEMFDDERAFTDLHELGFFTDLLEATKWGNLKCADRDFFRRALHLVPEEVREKSLSKSRTFQVCFKIKLGQHQTGFAYIQELERKEMGVDWRARRMLENPSFTCASKIEELELVVVSPFMLGFMDHPMLPFVKKHPTFGEVFEVAEAHNLFPCPAEVGPALRLAYNTQSKTEVLSVAMQGIDHGEGYISVFDLERRDDCLRLGSTMVRDDRVESLYYYLVFCFRSARATRAARGTSSTTRSPEQVMAEAIRESIAKEKKRR